MSSTSTHKLSSQEIAALVQARAKAEHGTGGTRSSAKGWVKKGDRYQALIGIGRAKVYLGTFSTPEEAAAAFQRAAQHRDTLRGQATATE